MSRFDLTLTLSDAEKSALLRVFPKGIIALDLETTGLSPLVDKVIELAAIKLTPNGELTVFHELINPLIDIPEHTIQFHGLRNHDLEKSPTLKKPLKQFWQFCERIPVLAHNAQFDLGFLIKGSHDFLIEFPPLDVYDSCRMARSLLKDKDKTPKNFKLSSLAEFYDIDLAHHQALSDTMTCLKMTANLLLQEEKMNSHLEKSFVFRLSQFEKNDCFHLPKKFDELKVIVQERKLLHLVYKGQKGLSERPIRPIGLIPLPKGSILFAECLMTGMNKSFMIKKIKSFNILEGCYLPRRS